MTSPQRAFRGLRLGRGFFAAVAPKITVSFGTVNGPSFVVAASIRSARSGPARRPRQLVATCHRYFGEVPQATASARRLGWSEMNSNRLMGRDASSEVLPTSIAFRNFPRPARQADYPEMTTKTTLTGVKANRRANLAALLDTYGKTRLGELVDINPDYLFQMGRGAGKSSRSLSDSNAVKIERALKLQPGILSLPPGERITAVSAREIGPNYVRFSLLDGGAGMGDGVVNDDFPEVVREVEMAAWEVRRKLGYIPEDGRIRLITGRGPSMRPMIDNGDVVLVDTSVSHFDGDAVYVINIGGETQIKVLQMRADGLYVVSKNQDYPAYRVEKRSLLHIGGKVVATLGIKEL